MLPWFEARRVEYQEHLTDVSAKVLGLLYPVLQRGYPGYGDRHRGARGCTAWRFGRATSNTAADCGS